MPITLEVRWFERAPLPPNLRDWFDQLTPKAPRTWTDFYLPCEDTSLNLKAREGQIQIKRRLAGPSLHSFGSDIAGYTEQWIKWSFNREEGEISPWTKNRTGLWVPVQKTRRQRTFDAETQSSLTDALPAQPPATVKIELTTLSALDTAWWTLCLETEGPPENLFDTLFAAGEALLDGEVATILRADRSFGYIRWLQRHPRISSRPHPDVLASEES